MDHYQRSQPIVARATAAGPGAIAVLRCSGEGTFKLLRPLFSRPQALTDEWSHRAQLGWLLDDSSGERIDQLLVLPFAQGRSYTGEESVELHCHGGEAVVERVQQLLLKRGFSPALPGEFSYRAFVHGKMDLTQAEAVAALSGAVHQQQRQQALQQLGGGMEKEVQRLHQDLLHLLATLEVQLDYPEEEVQLHAPDWSTLNQARQRLEQMMEGYRISERHRRGVHVVLVGPVNAGKSSLFNLLLRRTRAIVSPQPGTTRDYLDAEVELDHHLLHLYDTAGLRVSQDQVEQRGIRASEHLIEQADVIIFVADATEGEDLLTKERLPEGTPCVAVWNKCDLEAAQPAPDGWLPFSCQHGVGLASLYRCLQQHLPPAPPTEGVFPINVRQYTLLHQSVAALDEAASLQGQSHDMVAESLRFACDSLGELCGRVARADLLESIFAGFCLGK